MTRTRARACEGKKAHPSKADAVAHLRRKVDQGAFFGSLITYRCRHCRKWHVGHPLGSASGGHINPNRGGNAGRRGK